MLKIADLHNHLDTLPFLFNLRNRLQGHKISLSDYLTHDSKVIISVAFYVTCFGSYSGLLRMIRELKYEIKMLGDNVKLLESKSDLESNFSLGLIFHVESARLIKNPKDQLPELFDNGVRGIIPLHFVDNHLGTSCDDILRRSGFKRSDFGLTQAGEDFVELCNELGIWLDLTHTTDQTASDLLESANEIMVSHIGVRDIKNLSRNKSIDFYKKIAKKNGVIGIIPWEHLIGSEKHHYQLQFKTLISEQLQNHICIGTDYGAPIKTHKDFKSAFDLGGEIKELPKSDDLLWNNAFRFFKRALPS